MSKRFRQTTDLSNRTSDYSPSARTKPDIKHTLQLNIYQAAVLNIKLQPPNQYKLFDESDFRNQVQLKAKQVSIQSQVIKSSQQSKSKPTQSPTTAAQKQKTLVKSKMVPNSAADQRRQPVKNPIQRKKIVESQSSESSTGDIKTNENDKVDTDPAATYDQTSDFEDQPVQKSAASRRRHPQRIKRQLAINNPPVVQQQPKKVQEQPQLRCIKVSQSLINFLQSDQSRGIPSKLKVSVKSIETKLQKGQLITTKEFKDEVRKLIASGYSDNAVDGAGYAALANLLKFFEDQVFDMKDVSFRQKTPEAPIVPVQRQAQIQSKLQNKVKAKDEDKEKVEQMQKQIESLQQELQKKQLAEEIKTPAPVVPPPKKQGRNTISKPVVTPKDINTFVKVHDRDKPLSTNERNALTNLIQTKLTQEQLQGILEIIRDESSVNKNGSECTFDLNTLPARKQREIEAYVKKCMQTNQPGVLTSPQKGLNQAPRVSGGVARPMKSAGSSTSASGIRSGQVNSSQPPSVAPLAQQTVQPAPVVTSALRPDGVSSSSSSSSSDLDDNMGEMPRLQLAQGSLMSKGLDIANYWQSRQNQLKQKQ